MEKIKLEEVKNLVRDYIIKEFIEDDETEILDNTPLISSGYIDSFSMVSLLVFLEKQFKIKIPPRKATPEAFDSINNIVNLLTQFIEHKD